MSARRCAACRARGVRAVARSAQHAHDKMRPRAKIFDMRYRKSAA